MKKIKGITDNKDYLALVSNRRLAARALLVSILAFAMAFVTLLLKTLDLALRESSLKNLIDYLFGN